MNFLSVCVSALVAVSQARVDPFFRELLSHFNDGNSRIAGGDEVVPHSRPFQVALFIYLSNEDYRFCGGSLIDEQWILTAAHCLDDAHQIRATLGAHKVFSNEKTQQRFISTKFYVHPDWSYEKRINDIALIKLPQKAQLNEFVATIAIPEREDPDYLVGVQATVSGWGKTTESGIGISPVLRKVSNEIISNSDCARSFLQIVPIFKDSLMCMSGEGIKSSCNGDSGGPLTCVIDGKEVVVGCVSLGRYCDEGYPYVYPC